MVVEGLGFETVRHSQRPVADINHKLERKPALRTQDADPIIEHAQGHSRVVRALQFNVQQTPGHQFRQQVDALVLHLRQLHIEPFRDRIVLADLTQDHADRIGEKGFSAWTSQSCIPDNREVPQEREILSDFPHNLPAEPDLRSLSELDRDAGLRGVAPHPVRVRAYSTDWGSSQALTL